MIGVECALTGRLGRPPELRQTKTGKAMAVLNVAVDEGEGENATTWAKVLGFEAVAEACRELQAAMRLYVEGRAKVEQWTARGGTPRAGLTVLARLVQPMGVGRRRPKPQPGPVTRPGHAPAARRSEPPPVDQDGFDWRTGDFVPELTG